MENRWGSVLIISPEKWLVMFFHIFLILLFAFSELLPGCSQVVALTVCLWVWPCCSGEWGLLSPFASSLPGTAFHLLSAEALGPSLCRCRASTLPGTNICYVGRPRSDRKHFIPHVTLRKIVAGLLKYPSTALKVYFLCLIIFGYIC